jgi:hypothetical protein
MLKIMQECRKNPTLRTLTQVEIEKLAGIVWSLYEGWDGEEVSSLHVTKLMEDQYRRHGLKEMY